MEFQHLTLRLWETHHVMTDGQILKEPGQVSPILGSVSAAYVQALVDTAVAQGADRTAILSRAAIHPAQLTEPAWRLEVTGLLRLFDVARELSGNELIGLHMGMSVRPRTFSALGYAAMSCSTLGEAVMLIPRYEGVVYDGGVTTVRSQSGQVRVAWRSGLNDRRRTQPINEAIVAGWLSFGRWITGMRGEMREVCFQHPPPPNIEKYDKFFGCPVRFEAEDNALTCDMQLMALPLVQHDDQLRKLMEQQAQNQLRDLRGPTLTLRVITAIRQRLPQQTLTTADIASMLGLSERTLRRHLQTEGHSLSELLTRVRKELAQHYLADRELSLTDIALLLGYAEQTSFTAAFKAWTGLPPGEYRLRQFGD